MNTRVGKSFGLALIVAVGILALMLALGTFNAQKVGADIDETNTDNPIVIVPNEPGPGAAVQVIVAFDNNGTVLDTFEPIEITLEGWGIPDSIENRSVQVRQYGTDSNIADASPTEASLPIAVTVSGQKITVEVDADTDDGTIGFTANNYGAIVFRQSAGLTAPTLAGKYDVTIKAGDSTVTSEELVTVSASLSLDPTSGGSGTDVTVSGKAFSNGTASLYTEYLKTPDGNNDGILDTLINSSADDLANANVPTTSNTQDYTLDVDGDGEKNYDLLLDDSGDPNVYKAVPIDDTNLDNVVDLGYTISRGADDGVPPNAPTIPATVYEDEELLKDVTVSDGAFSTTVDAGDLVFGGPENRSQVRIVDADGLMSRATFQVTGTMSLGSDSVGKGRILKISLADWISELPDEVKIGGVTVAEKDSDLDTAEDQSTFVDKDGKPTSAPTMAMLDVDPAGELDFYVKVGGEVGLGTKSVVLFDGGAALAGARASVAITANELTVSPSTAVVGQEVAVTGSGFTGNVTMIDVGGVIDCDDAADCNIAVASGGRIAASVSIPNDALLADAGEYTISVTDSEGRIGTGTVTIPEPTLTVNPEASRIGTTIELSGTGWPIGTGANLVQLHYGGIQYATAVTRSDGTWSSSIEVPVTAQVGQSNDVEAKATVGVDDPLNVTQEEEHRTPDPTVTLSSAQAQRGSYITVSGANFHTFRTVIIEIGDSVVTPSPAPTTDANGSFSDEVLVPGLGLGSSNLKVTVNNIPVVEFLDIVATPDEPVVTTQTASEVFAAEVASGNLVVAWRFDNDSGVWSFYDPTLDEADNSYGMAATGDIVWLNLKAATTFQGASLNGGWQLVTLQ